MSSSSQRPIPSFAGNGRKRSQEYLNDQFHSYTNVDRGRKKLKPFTLPETNVAPENSPSQKETIVFQPSIFRGELLVSGRVFGGESLQAGAKGREGLMGWLLPGYL